MVWTILDSTGDLIESYDSEGAALDALGRVDAEDADDVLMVAFDDSGMPVGEAVSATGAREVIA